MSNERWRSQSFSKIKSRRLRWLLKPFIPRGMITVVTGESGIGKSTFIIDLIARITTGDDMPQFGDLALEDALEGSALIICKEDDPGLVIKPRLRAAGADMNRVHMSLCSGRGYG
jgi:RecA-family ATPase